MFRGEKTKYSDKQKHKAEHLEEGYKKRGTSKKEAERRAWATVNKISGGGKKKGGSGQRKSENTKPAKKGGTKGGKSAAERPAKKRSASARKAVNTRKQRSNKKKSPTKSSK